MAALGNLRMPDPLRMTGSNIADDWRRFRDQFSDYELAADLTDASQQKRAAVFLTCIGNEAYDAYRAMEFEDGASRKKLDPIIAAFERFCVGAVNVTFERYEFNRRVQETGERFDIFLGDVRRLARSCDFAGVEESLIRDRIVVGIRDDSTRHKLLQIRDLTLPKAVDICKASEAAGKQMKAMSGADQIQSLNTSKRTSARSRGNEKLRGRESSDESEERGRGKSPVRRCKYCDRKHEARKEACPAYNKICRKCARRHHFEVVCQSRGGGKKSARHVINDIETDEELLVLGDFDADRWYTRLKIGGRTVRFLLDCGATVNLLPESLVRSIGRQSQVRPAAVTVRMFDKSELQTRGMITVVVQHPRTAREYKLDFYVAAKHEQPLLGFKACRALELLRVVDENICAVRAISPADTLAEQPSSSGCITEAEVLAEYADLFDGVGQLDGDVHLEIDETVPPVQMPLRRLPIGVRDKVATELQRMEENGIIESVTEPSSWVSALLVVTKANGNGIRICIDPKPLNKALKRAHYRMPTIDDILPQLSGAKIFSTVDAKDGFWHLKLDQESSRLTTFETPFGRYRWRRLPFGISPAPEIFQARMHAVLSGLQGISCIADDILISGAGETEAEAAADHNRNLRALLDRCREKGIKLNRLKLKLNRPSTVYCGHELTRCGVKPDQRKVAAILNMPPPSDRQGVLRLLGMATYNSKYCPNFSNVTAPIRALLLKDSEFVWQPDIHGVAFDKLKTLLVNAPALAYFDPTKPITVQSDASQCGLGAVLLCDGRPVEYASRAMTRAECDYAQIEKELLSVIFAMEHWHTYTYARHVTCETDHKPLISIAKKALASAPKRLQRMLLRLQRYTIDLVYVPGSSMVLADTLSRAYPPADTGSKNVGTEFTEEMAALSDNEQLQELRMVASQRTIDNIRTAAAEDDEYNRLIEQIHVGWPASSAAVPAELQPYATFADELIVSGGLVFKGNRVVIPHGARDDILQRVHASHIGVNGCIRRAREAVFFPGITAAIKDIVSRCPVCVRYQNEQQKEPVMSPPAPSRPWEKVGTDIFYFHGQDYLVTVDYLSGYFEVDRLPSKKVSDVIYALRQQFSRHGIPLEVVSDNSPFGSTSFKAFAERYEFKHTTSSPRWPMGNSRAEAGVKMAKRLMMKASESGSDPLLALLDWRNTPSEQLGPSPAQLMFGRRTRTRLPTADALLSTPSAAAAQGALSKAKERQAFYYNRGAKERPTLPVGQTVRMRFDDGDWRKAEVARILPHRSYELRMEDGSTRRRTSRHVRFSSEPPIIITSDSGDGNPIEATNRRAHGSKEHLVEQTAIQPVAQPAMNRPMTVTRFGRVVKTPARFKD